MGAPARVAVEPDGPAPRWWPAARIPDRPDRPLSPLEGQHRRDFRRRLDLINTVTPAELRWREGAYAWPRQRVATWLVVVGYLLALATIVTALLLEGLQAVEDRHSAPPETSKTLPAQTVQVPVPGGDGR